MYDATVAVQPRHTMLAAHRPDVSRSALHAVISPVPPDTIDAFLNRARVVFIDRIGGRPNRTRPSVKQRNGPGCLRRKQRR
jgi:hypothetical protein